MQKLVCQEKRSVATECAVFTVPVYRKRPEHPPLQLQGHPQRDLLTKRAILTFYKHKK
jgi:hypothetical protein